MATTASAYFTARTWLPSTVFFYNALLGRAHHTPYPPTLTPTSTSHFQASTPGKKRPWHELPSTEKNGTARKREWGEVSTSSAPSPLEPVYSSPNVCNWAERGRGWGTPRAGEPTPWVGKGGRGSQSASGARRGQPHPWRRASGDFEQVAVLAATRSNEDSLGYPLLPCDGRECKVRVDGWGVIWLQVVRQSCFH